MRPALDRILTAPAPSLGANGYMSEMSVAATGFV